jgi:hypothetical protein
VRISFGKYLFYCALLGYAIWMGHALYTADWHKAMLDMQKPATTGQLYWVALIVLVTSWGRS